MSHYFRSRTPISENSSSPYFYSLPSFFWRLPLFSDNRWLKQTKQRERRYDRICKIPGAISRYPLTSDVTKLPPYRWSSLLMKCLLPIPSRFNWPLTDAHDPVDGNDAEKLLSCAWRERISFWSSAFRFLRLAIPTGSRRCQLWGYQ